MFRALWIKQWVQLRTLRWVGFGLGILLPFFLWAGAGAARRGWFGFKLAGYDLTTLFAEALPAFCVVLWCLLALMFAAQTFAGDRADGTDRFLLERPVPPARTWLARVLASLASTLIVVLGHTLYMLALVALVTDGSGAVFYKNLLLATSAGIGLALLGTIGGMAAGEMVRTPMQAVLIGGVLAALPIGVAMFLTAAFQTVSIFGVHLGFVIAPFLPLAMILMSYRAGCLGEPSGRGRIKRGVTILVLGLLVTPALFAVTTPFVLRATVIGAWPQSTAATADRAVLLGGGYRRSGGWMIDTEKKSKIRFLPPPVTSVAWNDDGSILAVIHLSGFLGSIGKVKLELIDANGDTLRSDALQSHRWWLADFRVQWAGERVMVIERYDERTRISTVDPNEGVVGEFVVAHPVGGVVRLLGPTDSGSIYVHSLTDADPRTYSLRRLDMNELVLEEPLLTEDGDLPMYTRMSISPSGRYWARGWWRTETKTYESWVIDLETGMRTDYPNSLIEWLSGDRQLRTEWIEDERRLVVQDGVDTEILTRRFSSKVGGTVSPDGRRFLVTVWSPGTGTTDMPKRVDGLLIGDGSDWTELQSLQDDLGDGSNWSIRWGGPNTLIAYSLSTTLVADAKPGAKWTAVLGRHP